MRYKNYAIEKLDDKNWTVKKTEDRVSQRKTDSLEKGDTYTAEVLLGYYGNVGLALSGIVKDCAGVGCDDISELAQQIKELRADLVRLGEGI